MIASEPLPTPLAAILSRWTAAESLANEGYLQVEGAEAVRWLLASEIHIVAIVGKASSLTSLEPDILALRAARPDCIYPLSKSDLAQTLGFRFDRGVVALARMPELPSEEQWLRALEEQPSWGLIFADAIHDPANIGTIIRSGRCLGGSGIILSAGCANPLSRRAIRSGVGHPLRWPLLHCSNPAQTLQKLTAIGAEVIAGHRGPQAKPITEKQIIGKRWVLVMGNEDRGLRPEILEHCPDHRYIAMSKDCDSLNVAAATAILLHHLLGLGPSALANDANSNSALSVFLPNSSP